MHRIGRRLRSLGFGLSGVIVGILLLFYEFSNLDHHMAGDSVRRAV